MNQWSLPEDRFFDPNPAQREVALDLYKTVADLPLVCPHGHVDPRMFSDPDYVFGSPTELLIIPDHYVFRMLYSQGVPLADLGVPRGDGGPTEQDHRKIWQIFAENFFLFQGTPSGVWLRQELVEVFGIDEKLNGDNAPAIYDAIAAKLATPEFKPRALFERCNIEVLCTTDAAHDTLEQHQAIRESGWAGKVVPTFRPDAVINLDAPGWSKNLAALSTVVGYTVDTYAKLVQALEERRAFFKTMGAHATDHAALTAYTGELSAVEANAIFQRALMGKATTDADSHRDAARFTGHMLMEMARMSIEDGLVMQVHVGSFRNHNAGVFDKFGADKGCDIPITSEFTRNFRPLLAKYGNDPRLNLILFTLDETTYSRELATLAGHYPTVKIGPPWWFHDSLNGMRRYFDTIMETAGIYNTAGFNDDTRAFPSIPARHDVWRRAAANWVAGLVVRHIVDLDDANAMCMS